jgi:RNA polymerase sigma-70 factor (ECF subfamily)
MLVENISDKILEIKELDLEKEVGLEAELAMKLLHQLPINQKIIINLFLIDDFSHREIAQKLNISEEASRTQYRRAKKHLIDLVKFKLQKNEQQG